MVEHHQLGVRRDCSAQGAIVAQHDRTARIRATGMTEHDCDADFTAPLAARAEATCARLKASPAPEDLEKLIPAQSRATALRAKATRFAELALRFRATADPPLPLRDVHKLPRPREPTLSDRLAAAIRALEADRDQWLSQNPTADPNIIPLLPLSNPELRAEAKQLILQHKAGLSVDAENAYNRDDRAWQLAQQLAVCPAMSMTFNTFYRGAPPLFITKTCHITSDSGYRQGDPPAQPGFALSGWFQTRTIQVAGCDALLYWDDTTAEGVVPALARA